jgi:hypothetical protein
MDNFRKAFEFLGLISEHLFLSKPLGDSEMGADCESWPEVRLKVRNLHG